MNNSLSNTALKALTAPGFETGKGYCWRFVRQCIQKCYGLSEPPSYHRATAKDAGLAMLAEGKAHRYNGDPKSLQIGDILFKTVGSGGYGHVGILTPKGVAENSSAHWDGHDARGLRSPEAFGAFQIVGRLPDPQAKAEKPVAETGKVVSAETVAQSVIIAHYDGEKWIAERVATFLDKGTNWAPVREILATSGAQVTEGQWGDGTPALYVKRP